jgi:hypothetical protein
MKYFKFFSPLFLAIILNNSYAQTLDNKLSARDVINNSISALGGKEYLLSIKTLYTDFSTEMDGRKVHWITKEMMPNKGSFQIVYNDRTVYRDWFDGEKGFEISKGQKVDADPDEFKDKKFKRNIFDEIDYLDTTLWKLELLNDQKVNEEDCYRIKATLANGLVKIIYISKTSFYTLREDKVANPEKDSFSTTTFSDYKKFGKLTFYSTMKFGDPNNPQIAKIIELLPNDKITDNDFK